MRIFVSHSSADKALAAAFVELLRLAISGLRSGDIRCTSLDGYGFPPGIKFEDQIRAEVFEAELLVALLTPVSMRSTYVLFELGARWGASKPLFVACFGGLRKDFVEGPLASTQNADGSNEADLIGLVTVIGQVLGLQVEPVQAFLVKLKHCLAEARALETLQRSASANTGTAVSAESEARIDAPSEQDLVPQRLKVTGHTVALQADRRLWLVVEIGSGSLYPQCPVTNSPGPWTATVRIGRDGPGLDAGARYTIHLVAVGLETDYQYTKYIRGQHENKDGMGSIQPADFTILDTRRVIRT